MRATLPFALLLLLVLPVAAQFAPAAPMPPAADVLDTIKERSDRLARQIGTLRQQGVPDPWLVDVEVYLKAATWIVRHGEWYQKEAGAWTLDVLDRGLLRAGQQARGDSPWLNQIGHSVVRAYRSNVDGSVQPYAVTFPTDYGKAPRKWRLDVVLHGRNANLTEVSFLKQHDGSKAAPKDQSWVQIDIFGRTNNAYRWAGESDVHEVLDAFLNMEKALKRDLYVDRSRFILRGFSMGGAGTWHLGLHHPDRWCAINPGAGFTTTHGYVKDLPAQLPPYLESCLRIYDAVDYAENAVMIPVVAYSGSIDPQKAAADNIQKKLEALGIPMTHIVAPGLAHVQPAGEWRQKIEEEFAKYLKKGRPEYPPRVRFVTYTLKYDHCDWVQVLALDKHYERSLVEADHTDEGFTIKTANVRALNLRLPAGATKEPVTVKIDGQELKMTPYPTSSTELDVYLEKRDGAWQGVLPERLAIDRVRRPQKVSGVQGPIDDAFTTGFLCVRGTGKAWHEGTAEYADANLERFRQEWSRFLRGDLPVKDDADVTPEDITNRHLILFGDPASNSLIAQVLPDLPLKWTKDKISWNGQEHTAADHVPVLIYPSPLSANRYVVLNSGHTFHAADFQGTNALLYPRLGDYAVLKRVPTPKDPLAVEVVRAGLFDDFWHVPGR
jgi:pimeloyl-ACP methyl ester carboxylesterase